MIYYKELAYAIVGTSEADPKSVKAGHQDGKVRSSWEPSGTG